MLAFLHLFPALLFVTLGPVQFARPIREGFPALHRWSGRVYLLAAALIAYSAVRPVFHRSFGGPSETAATIFFTALFVCCLGIAFSHIRNRRVRQHREWMIRGFAIGLAVVTIRTVVGIYLSLSDYSVQQILGTAFWISFTTHLIAAEVWIHLTRPQQSMGIQIHRDSRSNEPRQPTSGAARSSGVDHPESAARG